MAAQINTQVEFDRAFRTIVKSDEYRGSENPAQIDLEAAIQAMHQEQEVKLHL